MYMLLISSCACWICIKHQIDVITLSPSLQKCNVIIGNEIVISFVSRLTCSFLYLSLSLSTLY